MQISGAIEHSTSFLITLSRSLEARATSATLVPFLVLIAHSTNTSPPVKFEYNNPVIFP